MVIFVILSVRKDTKAPKLTKRLLFQQMKLPLEDELSHHALIK